MSISFDMTGKAALVTGAAGGLGRATAVALAKAGADVCLVDLNAEGLAETARLVATKAHVHATDLGKPDNCKAAVAAAVEAFGRLDALCNVAGVLKLVNAHEMSVEDWRLIIGVNLDAPFFLCQAAIPHLLASGDGAIVNVSSLAAHIGEAYGVAYCASKGGVSQMTKALAVEYMNQPLRINAISPGGMNTPMGASFAPPPGADLSLLANLRPPRGLVELEDMANMIAYLASPASRGFHGADLQMDKGMTAG
jgi:NAD(P)-dependent dehydrogenase (short-subunit alcohol dehydrogenase family)